VHSLYRTSTRGPEDDSVESKHVTPISHYMFNIITVVFDGPSAPLLYQNDLLVFSSSSINFSLTLQNSQFFAWQRTSDKSVSC